MYREDTSTLTHSLNFNDPHMQMSYLYELVYFHVDKNGALTLLEAMLSTVKLRVQQEVNIYQFEVDNIYCQLKEIMDFREDSLKY